MVVAVEMVMDVWTCNRKSNQIEIEKKYGFETNNKMSMGNIELKEGKKYKKRKSMLKLTSW